MGPKLIEAITARLCSHEFAWPRRRANGDYYQVCVLCAAEYLYDWNSMTRTGRIERAVGQPGSPAVPHRSRRRTNWRPRARRLRVEVPVRYREANTDDWHSGTVLNISQSGVLFNGHKMLHHDTDVEMIFEMPEEITGQPNSRVLCNGYIVRASSAKTSPSSNTLAAAISGYVFLHDNQK